MAFLNLILPLGVFVAVSDCLPVNNSTLSQPSLKVSGHGLPSNFKPTADRSLPGGRTGNKNTGKNDESPTISTRFKPIPSEQTPPCAKDSTFCEHIDDYPGSHIENIFKNAVGKFHELLGKDLLNSSFVVTRFDGPREMPLCDSTEEIVFPKTAKTKDEKWLYVVNEGSYVQGVRIEKCMTKGDSPAQSCSFAESFPIGYKATCKQKFIYRKLVAIDKEGEPITDTFQLPSCCSCTVVNNGLSSRSKAPIRKPLSSTTTSASPK